MDALLSVLFVFLYLERFGLPHGDAPGSRFDVMRNKVSNEEKNAGIALATARLMECVFNTMPQALFHRASIFDEVGVFFLHRNRSKSSVLGITSGMNLYCISNTIQFHHDETNKKWMDFSVKISNT